LGGCGWGLEKPSMSSPWFFMSSQTSELIILNPYLVRMVTYERPKWYFKCHAMHKWKSRPLSVDIGFQ
jgi:hypothetical protein